MHIGSEPANEVDSAALGRSIHGFGERREVLRATCCGDKADGRGGDALVDDRNAIVRRDGVAHRDHIFAVVHDLGVDLLARRIDIGVSTVPEADAKRDGADVERLQLDHAHRFENLLVAEAHEAAQSNACRQ